jgi:hypothetical protein
MLWAPLMWRVLGKCSRENLGDDGSAKDDKDGRNDRNNEDDKSEKYDDRWNNKPLAERLPSKTALMICC